MRIKKSFFIIIIIILTLGILPTQKIITTNIYKQEKQSVQHRTIENAVYWTLGGDGSGLIDYLKQKLDSSTMTNLTKIEFNNISATNKTITSDISFDLSKNNDGSVLVLVKENTVYIQYDGILYFNEDSRNLFCDNLEITKITSITGLEYINTSNVTDMSYMFNGLSSLTELDVSNFDTSNVTDMEWMFCYMVLLKKIYVSPKFKTDNVKSDYPMFTNSTNLKGWNNTRYNNAYTGKDYARIDTPNTPGYFSLKVVSDQYIVNEEKNYIYLYTDSITQNIIDNLTVPENIDLAITSDNKLQVKNKEDILKEFTLINISSDIYYLAKDYIYIGTEQIDLTKINVINGTIIEEDEKLKVKHNEETIYEYNILSINFKELSIKGKSIIITEDIPYEDFISNITPNGVTYKIYDEENEVTEGTITKDMVLKIYKDDEKIYEYQITDEFLDLTLLTIDEEESLIKNLKLGTTISSFKENILTSGSVKILDQDGEELKGSDLVRSGAKVVIELSKDKYEYTLSVKGDVTGTGTSTVSDVGKLYQYLRKKIPMEKCYIEAGNVTDTDNEIKITDVGKLYQFIKGKIDSLEG